jgi:hypothetical protein
MGITNSNLRNTNIPDVLEVKGGLITITNIQMDAFKKMYKAGTTDALINKFNEYCKNKHACLKENLYIIDSSCGTESWASKLAEVLGIKSCIYRHGIDKVDCYSYLFVPADTLRTIGDENSLKYQVIQKMIEKNFGTPSKQKINEILAASFPLEFETYELNMENPDMHKKFLFYYFNPENYHYEGATCFDFLEKVCEVQSSMLKKEKNNI